MKFSKTTDDNSFNSSAPVERDGRTRSGRLIAHLRVRGENSSNETAATCKGLEDAIRFAKRTFQNFDDRNPWVFHDSVMATLYILIDAEPQ